MVSSDYRAIARGALTGNWGTAILVSLVTVLLGGSVGGGSSLFSSGSSSANYNAQSNSPYVSYYMYGIFTVLAVFAMVYFVVALILGGAVTQGNCLYNIDLVTKQRPAVFGTLFSRFAYFGKALLLNLVMGLFIFLWSLLLIVPGIIAAYSYSMAPYLMAQNPNLGVMDAIRTSKELMRGNRWRLFCLQISFIGWGFLCILTLGIGFLWLYPYQGAAVTAFYLDLTRQLPGAPGYYGQPQGYQPPYPGGPYQQYPGAQAQGYAQPQQPGYPPQGQYQQPYQQQGYAQPQQPGYPPQDAYQQPYPQYPPQQQAYPQQPYAQPGYPPQPGYPAAEQPQPPVYQQPVPPPQPPPAPEYTAPVQPQPAPAPEPPPAAPAAPPVYTVPVEPAAPAVATPVEPVAPAEPAIPLEPAPEAPAEPAPESPIIPPYPQDDNTTV